MPTGFQLGLTSLRHQQETKGQEENELGVFIPLASPLQANTLHIPLMKTIWLPGTPPTAKITFSLINARRSPLISSNLADFPNDAHYFLQSWH